MANSIKKFKELKIQEPAVTKPAIVKVQDLLNRKREIKAESKVKADTQPFLQRRYNESKQKYREIQKKYAAEDSEDIEEKPENISSLKMNEVRHMKT